MEELKKDKKELEMKINKMVREFEDKWDVVVTDVFFTKSNDLSGKTKTFFTKVGVEI